MSRRHSALLCVALLSVVFEPASSFAADRSTPAPDPVAEARRKMAGFDTWMEQIREEWNCPGLGVALVVGDSVVFAKGYGFRDWGAKLPFTSRTVAPIGSDTKLFTAVVAGTLVDEGKLAWDDPIRNFVPSIRFHDDALDDTVSLRDMLSHRTGLASRDKIFYKSDLSRQELFDRLKYLEPIAPIRTKLLYNNMVYGVVGRALELVAGESWEQLVRERILDPVGMTGTSFTVTALASDPDRAVPWNEGRDGSELHQIPYYPDLAGVGPAGAINSNLDDLTRWVRLLLGKGKIEGRQLLAADIFDQTTAPAMPTALVTLEAYGWTEELNPIYGMGRVTSIYRGQRVVYHGGGITGFQSEVAIAPEGGFGLVVLVIGNQAALLPQVVKWELIERMFEMKPRTAWNRRYLDLMQTMKQADAQARREAVAGRVEGTHPAHPLADYVGEYEHPAYGVVSISVRGDELEFGFHRIRLPLSHFHFERFDTPDDEIDGRWSVNFGTGPQGRVTTLILSLDGGDVTFVRREDAPLPVGGPPNR